MELLCRALKSLGILARTQDAIKPINSGGSVLVKDARSAAKSQF